MCSYNIPQRDATPRTPLGELTALPQTSGLDFGDRKGRGKKKEGKEKGDGKEKEGKRRDKRKRGQREGRAEEGKEEREEFCAVVIFRKEKPWIKRRDNCRPSLLARVRRPVVMRGATIKSCGDGVVFVFARWRLVGVDRQAVVGPANGPLSTNRIKQL